jgi:hypothetical protein
LGKYAKQEHGIILSQETYVTQHYWLLGKALEFARATLTKTQYSQFLVQWGVHKVRASKARAIAAAYPSPESVLAISVHDANDHIVKKRRAEKKQKQVKQAKEDAAEPAPPKEDSEAAASVLAKVNGRLDRLSDDLAFDSLGGESTEEVVNQIDKAIATLERIKKSIVEGKTHEE